MWFRLLALILTGLSLVTLVQLFVESSVAARRTNLLSMVTQCATASLLYAEDHDDRLPLAANWQKEVAANQKLPSEIFLSMAPRGELNPPEFIAFRDRFSGWKTDKIQDDAQTVLTFDSVITQPNAHGDLERMPNPPRWNYGGKQTNIVAFVDGHAKAVTISDPIR